MRDIINDLNVSYEARAIVITATGEKMFCPGADISTDRAVVRPEGAPRTNRRSEPAHDAQRSVAADAGDHQFARLPIIAAVNGTAAGVGAHLALVLRPGDHGRQREVHRGLRSARSDPRRSRHVDPAAAHRPAEGEGARASSPTTCRRSGRSRSACATRSCPGRAASTPRRNGPSDSPVGPIAELHVMKWLLNRSLDVDMRTHHRGRGMGGRAVTQTAGHDRRRRQLRRTSRAAVEGLLTWRSHSGTRRRSASRA